MLSSFQEFTWWPILSFVLSIKVLCLMYSEQCLPTAGVSTQLVPFTFVSSLTFAFQTLHFILPFYMEACRHTVNFYLSFWSQLKSNILMISSSLVWFVSHVLLHFPCHLIHILYYIIYCTILICLSFSHVHIAPSCENTYVLLIVITEPRIVPVKQSAW